MSDQSKVSSISEYPVEKRTLGYILEDKTRKNPDKIFLHFQGNQYTYKDTNRFADQLASGYMSLGLKKGDRATVMLPNCPDFIFSWFGLAKLGAVDNPINIAYKGDLLRHVIVNSGTKVLLIYNEYLERIVPIQDQLHGLEKIIIYGPADKELKKKIKFPSLSFEELIDHSPDFSAPEEVKYHDPLMIIYTSGTTGPSKGVVLPHNALYCYSMDSIKLMDWESNDIFFSCLPLFHINIRFWTIYPALLLESTCAMTIRFSASQFWNDMRKYNGTVFSLLGAMISFLLKQPPSKNDRDNPGRMFDGGPMSVEQAKAFEERFDVKVYTGYFGMSEANWITSLSVKKMDALKLEGKWPQVLGMGKESKERYEVKVVDDYDNEVPPGQVGELICRPARPYSMMLEYINMPDKTAETFRNLWFHTGDLVKKDEEGYLYFIDRKKDYIRRRGENVSSYEVEAAVNSMKQIAESAAIGITSPHGEEEILILIRLKEGESLSPQELFKHCEENMAKFMIPNYMKNIEDIPKTPTGRAQKYKIREMIDLDTITALN